MNERPSESQLKAFLRFVKTKRYEPMQPIPLHANHVTASFLRDGKIRSFDLYKSSENVVKAVIQTGEEIQGHLGLAHGGFLALLIDDVLGYGMEGLGSSDNNKKWWQAVTANLSINYLAVVPAATTLTIYVHVRDVKEDRKVSLKAIVVSSGENGKDIIHCDVASIQVIPRSKL